MLLSLKNKLFLINNGRNEKKSARTQGRPGSHTGRIRQMIRSVIVIMPFSALIVAVTAA